MPRSVVHFARRGRRTDTPGDRYDAPSQTIVCGADAYSVKTTTTKARVTCKKCRRKLGLDDAETPKVFASKTGRRPTAWDHLDAIPDDGNRTPSPEPEPVDLPAPPPPPPRPLPVPAAPWAARQEILRARIALIFFHLMRTHMGIDPVVALAEMCSRGVTGPGGHDEDLEQRASRLADLIMTPAHERV